MRSVSLALVSAMVVGLVVFGWVFKNDPQNEIAVLENFSKKLERAKKVDAETERTVTGLIALLRARGPQSDPNLEKRRQAAITRSESVLAKTSGSVERLEATASTK